MNELDQIKKEIADFEAFKTKLENRQIDYPLDVHSRNLIRKDTLVPTGLKVVPVGLGTWDESIVVKMNEKKYLLETTSAYLI